MIAEVISGQLLNQSIVVYLNWFSRLVKKYLRIQQPMFIMDARCGNCNNKANFDIEKNRIKCEKCGMEIDYDDYIEQMKEKAVTLADNFQSSWDKSGF